jgi:lanosterol synthase
MINFIVGCIAYVPHVWAAIWTMVVYFYDNVILGIPCSYPGDALENPLTRRGSWPDKVSSLEKGWKFACDDESHKISNKVAPEHKMTGESAGRQIWYFDKKAADGGVAEGFGGDRTFNPAENPNSSDKPFRTIQLQKWREAGGECPEEDAQPSDAYSAAVKGLQFYQQLQCDDGHWAGDYGGPNFLMPGLISALYVTKAPFPEEKKVSKQSPFLSLLL